MFLQVAIFHLICLTYILFLSLCVYVYLQILSQLSVDRHLDCFHVSDIVNSATVSTVVHISFQIRVFTFSIYMYPGVGLDHTLTLFLGFLRHIYSVVHRGYADVHFHKSYRKDPFFSHPLQHLLFVEFW